MTPRHPRAIWIDRFVMEFARRAPGAPPADVEKVAAEVYEEAHDMEPEEAVEAYVGFFHE